MILLLGATGYLGQAFAAEMRRRRLDFAPLTREAVNYTRLETLFSYVRKTRPTFIINAAGFIGAPNVDACEIFRSETVHANTLLPQTVARVCYLTNTPWGHVSSGCIFTGAKVRAHGSIQIERDINRAELRELFEDAPEAFEGFTEIDEPNFSFRSPTYNFYSGSKALAEEGLRWFGKGYLWRPRPLFDEFEHPRNVLSRLQAQDRIRDVVNSLSHRGDFVQACLDLWESKAPFGTYHVVNPGAVSGRQIAGMIQRKLKPGRSFEFWQSDEAFRAGRAPRPNGILDASKLLAAGVRLRPLREALEDSLGKWHAADPSIIDLRASLRAAG
jgi:dTDP-4-dehydrorhamnose reductase